MECKIDGCISKVFRLGLCGKHYHEKMLGNRARCSVVDCDKPVHGKGFCDAHYRDLVRSQNKPCVIEGCGRPVVTKGLCDAHRKRLDRRGELDTSRPHDWGSKSAHPLYEIWQWKKRQYTRSNMDAAWFDDFWAFVGGAGERPSKRHKMIRILDSEPLGPHNFEWRAPAIEIEKQESRAAYMRKWMKRYRETSPDRFAEYEFKRRSGLTLKEYNAMLAEQNSVCAICAKLEESEHHITAKVRRLAVDHCHAGGHVRGLLCGNCNTALGLLKDNPETLRAAIAYLEKHALPEPQ